MLYRQILIELQDQKINRKRLYFSMLGYLDQYKICDHQYEKISFFHYLYYNLWGFLLILIIQDLQSKQWMKKVIPFRRPFSVIFHKHSKLSQCMLKQANFFQNHNNTLLIVYLRKHQFFLYQFSNSRINLKMAMVQKGHQYHLSIISMALQLNLEELHKIRQFNHR